MAYCEICKNYDSEHTDGEPSMMSQVAKQQATYPIRVGGRLNCTNSEHTREL